MKKFAFFVLSLFACATMNAQSKEDVGCFKHYSVGVSAGTQGLGVEVATLVNDWVGLRADVQFMPGFHVNSDNVNVYTNEGSKTGNKMNVEASLGRVSFDVYGDFFLTKGVAVTAGFGFGGRKLLSLEGHSQDLVGKGGNILVDKSLVKVDNNGNMEGSVKVSAIRPYIGLGFGDKTVPSKRIGVRCDVGVFFQNTPKIYSGDNEVSSTVKESDSHGYSKIVKYMSVYPQLKISVFGKIL